ncbi:manganese efflux pump [Sulfobacillus thermosulfidooxidans]|uniref:manganese efflux pump n=1 Tax=Sulfobacillus thermosulfidooxidans TaxID=28034 RepID=UPI0002F984B0|nr:manganese efflux pump [Sulfobacillus thermosulfidooxidans]
MLMKWLTIPFALDIFLLSALVAKSQPRRAMTLIPVLVAFEISMLGMGLWFAHTISPFIKAWVPFISPISLIGLSIYLWFADDDDEINSWTERPVGSFLWIVLGLSVSLDEALVGLAIGFVQIHLISWFILFSLTSFSSALLGFITGSLAHKWSSPKIISQLIPLSLFAVGSLLLIQQMA